MVGAHSWVRVSAGVSDWISEVPTYLRLLQWRAPEQSEFMGIRPGLQSLLLFRISTRGPRIVPELPSDVGEWCKVPWSRGAARVSLLARCHKWTWCQCVGEGDGLGITFLLFLALGTRNCCKAISLAESDILTILSYLIPSKATPQALWAKTWRMPATLVLHPSI